MPQIGCCTSASPLYYLEAVSYCLKALPVMANTELQKCSPSLYSHFQHPKHLSPSNQKKRALKRLPLPSSFILLRSFVNKRALFSATRLAPHSGGEDGKVMQPRSGDPFSSTSWRTTTGRPMSQRSMPEGYTLPLWSFSASTSFLLQQLW